MDKKELMRNILRSAQTHQLVYAEYHDIQVDTTSFRGDLWVKVMLCPRNPQNGEIQRQQGGLVDVRCWVFRESEDQDTLIARFKVMTEMLSEPKNFVR